ncbi:SRPBCC family protein [Marinifilum sp. D714]|uniref:SRPBCC family protein n=1 Tax=Marinifilum sp. D714 TaxID=2937523 RepID=UPI0027BE6D1B|nr:SRPBCC family protein [Marinifilum sp. D714]MDQ2178421.1 SRPBCC family protein [Marinifilum sp. D714]
MKRYLILLVAVLVITTGTSLAQRAMTAAKKLPPTLQREGVVSASPDEVWRLISVLDKVDEYNSEFVKSVEKEGDGYEAYRLVKMTDGTERGEEVTVFSKAAKRICFKSEDSQYPVEYYIVNYYIESSGKSKTKLRLECYFKVNKGAAKTKTYKAIGKELSITLKGIQNYYNK